MVESCGTIPTLAKTIRTKLQKTSAQPLSGLEQISEL